MSVRLVAAAPLLAACTLKSGDGPCVKAVPGGFSDSTYRFDDTNFACEGLPGEEEMQVNMTSFTDYFNELPKTGALTRLTEARLTSAFEGAAGKWNAVPSTAITLTMKMKSSGVIKKNTINVMIMDVVDTDADTAAYRIPNISPDGHDVSCDIVIFQGARIGSASASATPINWSDEDPAPSDGYRIEDIVAHELGHCLGFDHPAKDAFGEDTHTDSIMFTWPMKHSARALSDTDKLALQWLYPPTTRE